MAYRLPARYRPPRRFRYPYRARGASGAEKAVGLAVGAVLASGLAAGGVKAVTHHHGAPHPAAVTPGSAGAAAVAFARRQVGRVPYVWGGTTTAGFDCSGLVQAAYRSAGIRIERTSEEQWASERHVSSPTTGDLVFFAGSDGTTASPGHVGIVVNPATHLMIDAYGSGTMVRYDTYGLPSSAGGLGSPVGFSDPAPAAIAVRVTSGSESAFFAAILADLGAPASLADRASLAAWYPHEHGSWPPAAANNPFDSTLPMPGSWPFNTLPGGGHVQNYPTAAEGAQATALTLENGRYPLIVASLRSGAGLCGNPSLAGEFLTWSGAYQGVC